MEENREFTHLHMDTIREIGNIGTGNAATALSKLIGRMVDMDVPVAELVPYLRCCGSLRFTRNPRLCGARSDGGRIRLHADVYYRRGESDVARGSHHSDDLKRMDEELRAQIRNGALAEQGNIILSAFLNALAQLTGWVLPASTPSVAHDMLGSLMNIVASMFGVMGDSAMLVKTSLHIKDLDEDLGGNGDNGS